MKIILKEIKNILSKHLKKEITFDDFDVFFENRSSEVEVFLYSYENISKEKEIEILKELKNFLITGKTIRISEDFNTASPTIKVNLKWE